MPYIIALCSAFLLGFSTVVNKYLLRDRKISPALFAFGNQFYAFVFFLVLTVIPVVDLGHQSWNGLSSVTTELVIIGLLYGFGSIGMFISLQKIDVGVYAILASVSTIISVLAGVFFLNEILTLWQLIGLGMILSGNILVYFVVKGRVNDSKKRYLLLGLVSAVFFGVAKIFDKSIITQTGVMPYLVLGFLLPAIIIGIFVFVKERHVLEKLRNPVISGKLVLSAFVYGCATFLVYLSLSQQSISITLSLVASNVVFAELLAVGLLKENRNIRAKLISTALVLCGIIFINLGV